MRIFHFGLVALLACAGLAYAQGGGMGGYDKMSVEAGNAVLNFKTGAIDQLTGAVKIRLTDSKSAEPPLPVEADSMRFTFEEGATQPSRIIMDGNVYVKHPQATVRAQHADYTLNSGDVVFTGSPIILLEGGSEIKGSKISLNMIDGSMQIETMTATEIDTSKMGGSATSDPSHLGEGEVADWPALAAQLKADAAAEGMNPTKRLLAHTGQEQFLQTLQGIGTETLLTQKGEVIKLMNGAIDQPGLYDEAAWQGRALGDEVTALMAKESREPAEEKQLNRLLIEAAYPAAFGG